ncbi:MAG: ROK family protein [Patescibacteria group bacterium]|nr:ROK family protein [Patescibacteria group bacterium]
MKNARLGVDIGGSKIRIVVSDGKKIFGFWEETNPSLAKLKQGIGFFGIKKLGVALPGLVDKKNNRILKCPNLRQFDGVDLKKELKGCEVKLDNDGKVFFKG